MIEISISYDAKETSITIEPYLSDSEIDYQIAAQHCLEAAISCLNKQGYSVEDSMKMLLVSLADELSTIGQ